jgi:hypothetical protein
MNTQNLQPAKLRPCSEIRIKRFEGGDERQTPIIFALLNLDSHTCRKSAFSLVPQTPPSVLPTAPLATGFGNCLTLRTTSDAVIMAKVDCWIRLTMVHMTDSLCSNVRGCIVGNQCDGLIILQAENLATGESPVPGNRKRG